MDYPEHDKLHKVREQSEAIGEFLENLEHKGIELAEWGKPFKGGPKGLVPIHKSRNTILAEYFEIDLKKLEAEKEQMLAEMRK